MSNKLLWVVGIVVVLAVGFAVVRGQQTPDNDAMMEKISNEMMEETKDTMMESTGASSGDSMMEKKDDKMMESSGTTGADAMMEDK